MWFYEVGRYLDLAHSDVDLLANKGDIDKIGGGGIGPSSSPADGIGGASLDCSVGFNAGKKPLNCLPAAEPMGKGGSGRTTAGFPACFLFQKPRGGTGTSALRHCFASATSDMP